MTRTGKVALLAVLGLSAASVATFGGVIGFGTFDGLGGGRTSENDHTIDATVDRVELATSAAEVEIIGADVDRIEVRERVRAWFGGPDRTFHVDGDTVTLDDAGCGWGCDVDYVVRVPADTQVLGSTSSGDIVVEHVATVDLRISSGELELADISGPVRAEASSGSISVERIAGDLRLEVSSGDIEGDELSGRTVDVHADSGDIELELIDPRAVRVDADSGDVELTVPDLPYRLTANADAGDIQDGLRRDDASDRTIDVGTGSGDIELNTTD